MYQHKDVFGENPRHGMVAGVLLSLAAAGFIVYAGMFAHNVSNGARDVRAIARQVGGVMVAVTKPGTQAERPTVERGNKSDNAYVLSDREAPGDVADVGEATSKKVLALQK